MTAIYHHTDTARLPWILESGELRAGLNAKGDFPEPDFVWATTRAVGDVTASASRRAMQAGVTRLARFVLDAEDFEPWGVAMDRFPQWTDSQRGRLIAEARRLGLSNADIDAWRAREAPLPRDRWLAIETRSWSDPTWRPLPLDTQSEVVLGLKDARAITVEGKMFCYQQVTIGGVRGYEVIPLANVMTVTKRELQEAAHA